jgi:hypothetical protein
MEERRQHPRSSFATEIWLGQDGIFTRTDERLASLSISGAFIETRQVYAPGSILNLRFKLSPLSDFITCTVTVRFSQGGKGFGVEFLDLSPEDWQRIKSFVEQRILSEVLMQTQAAISRRATAQFAAMPGKDPLSLEGGGEVFEKRCKEEWSVASGEIAT